MQPAPLFSLASVRFALLLAVALAFAPSLAPAQSQAADDAQILDLTIPFLTLRNRTTAADPGDMYGDERNGLSAGTCRVRELDLGSFAPLADQAPGFLREELLRLDQVEQMESAAVLDLLEMTADGHGPVIYVHGYNIGFEKGCQRAALLNDNAQIGGRLLWFSWPSDGSLAYYTHEEADLYWSVPDLADTIIELHRRFGNDNVNVVGHSLGGRGVILALYDVANRHPDIRLGEVVLLAPDMDFAIFERILPRISNLADSITLYVSDSDRPLALSNRLHGYPRLGEAGNSVAKLAGVEVIDVSDLPSSDPTGHLYHIYSEGVGADLNQLLNEGQAANIRQNIDGVGANLWRLRPREE